MKNLKISFTFVGTLIGAGFASGREIALFFGLTGIISPVIAGLFCGALAFVFLELGRLTDGGLLKGVFPKSYNIWNFLISAANFLVFSAMIAGAELTIKSATGFIGGGILTGLLAFSVVLGGAEKIKAVNFFAVPLIIALVVWLFLSEPSYDIKGEFSVSAPLLYTSMNILSGGFMVSKLSKGITKRQSVQISVIIGLILTLLITLIYLAVKNNLTDAMPILAVAEKHGLAAAGSALIFLAILTTAVGALSIASADKKPRAVWVLAGGFLLSALGFSNIVNYTYPVIGIAGVALSVLAAVRLGIMYRKRGKPGALPLRAENGTKHN